MSFRCGAGVRCWHEAADLECPRFGRFSNRPFGVKRLQTIHRCSVDVAPRARAFAGPLYGIFLVKKFKHGGASFFHRHFCRSESPFFLPEPASFARRLSGHTLTALSTMARLMRSG